MFFSFCFRNLKFSSLNVRSLASVRRAMKNHRKACPTCAYCGRSTRVDVHHIKSVSTHPELADDPNNLLTLCRRPACHHIIGHNGNWRDINPHAVELCALNRK